MNFLHDTDVNGSLPRYLSAMKEKQYNWTISAPVFFVLIISLVGLSLLISDENSYKVFMLESVNIPFCQVLLLHEVNSWLQVKMCSWFWFACSLSVTKHKSKAENDMSISEIINNATTWDHWQCQPLRSLTMPTYEIIINTNLWDCSHAMRLDTIQYNWTISMPGFLLSW